MPYELQTWRSNGQLCFASTARMMRYVGYVDVSIPSRTATGYATASTSYSGMANDGTWLVLFEYITPYVARNLIYCAPTTNAVVVRYGYGTTAQTVRVKVYRV